MRRGFLVFCLAIAFLVPATATVRADWQMAGGDAARTGSTAADPSSFPGLLWSLTLGGPLLGSPVVSRNPGNPWEATVFAVTGGTVTLDAVTATNGTLRWSSPLSAYVPAPWVFRAQGGLATDASRVYALITAQNGSLNEWREILVARMRGDGASSWSDLGTAYASIGTPQIASAPLLARDLVVFGSGDGHVRAITASTGALAWDVDLGNPIPLPVTFLETGNALVGDFILAEDAGGRVYGLDVNGTSNGDQGIPDPPGTGDLVWKTDLGTPAVTAAIATPSEALVAAANRVVALHPAFGSVIWSQTLPGTISGPLALAGTSLVFGADDGNLRALDTSNGAYLWVRSIGGAGSVQPWIVATPTRIFAASSSITLALSTTTGDVSWSATYGSPVTFASVSENATGRGVIYAGTTSPDRLLAFSGSSDPRPVDITITPISNPSVFQASIDATIKNAGDENVSRSFHVWVNDTASGVTTILEDAQLPYLKAGEGRTVHIATWNFSAGGHTIRVTVESVPGDRNLQNNFLEVKFFASVGPPKEIMVWSPAFWVALVVIGVAGVGAGFLVAAANRRRERELEGMLRERRSAGP